MIFRHYQRSVRRNVATTLLAVIVLTLGFAGAGVTYPVVLATLAPKPRGLQSGSFATVGENSSSVGGAEPLSWMTCKQFIESVRAPNVSIAAHSEPVGAVFAHLGQHLQISIAGVSSGFFGIFTAELEAGHDFTASWSRADQLGEIILSSNLAKRVFGSPAMALEQEISLNGQQFRVVGVSARSFSGLWSATDAWVPPDRIALLDFGPSVVRPKQGQASNSELISAPEIMARAHLFYLIAISKRINQDELHGILQRVIQSSESNQLSVNDGLTRDPIWDRKVHSWSQLALLIAILLLVAGALNYSGLLCADVPRQIEEMRLRLTLGASVKRILLEAMIAPVMTFLLAYLLAMGVTRGVLVTLSRIDLRFLLSDQISSASASGILFVGTIVLSALALLISLVPVVTAIRGNGPPKSGYTSTSNRRTTITLSTIVAGQIASCVLVWLVAAAITRTVYMDSVSDLGFSADTLNIFTVGSIEGSTVEFVTSDTRDFPLAAFTRLSITNSQYRLPGLVRAAAASCAPLDEPLKAINIEPLDSGHKPLSVRFCAVSRDFFETLGNPIIAGSGFSSHDYTGPVFEVVVNEKLARELWPEGNSLSRAVRIDVPTSNLNFTAHIVGVTRDMKLSGYSQTSQATLFLPLRGNVFSIAYPLYFLVKGHVSARDMEVFTSSQASGSLRGFGIVSSYRAEMRLRKQEAEQDLRVMFSLGGATLIGVIAYLGLYGVLSYMVNSKRKEMALRSCFGASSGQLRLLVVTRAVQCAGAGIVLAAFALKPSFLLVARSWAGNLKLSVPVAGAIFAGSIILAVFISLLPASRAAKLSLMQLLRDQ